MLHTLFCHIYNRSIFIISVREDWIREWYGWQEGRSGKECKTRPFPSCLLPLFAIPFTWKCVPPTGSFSCKSNSFSYERFCRRTRFETEAQDNFGVPYLVVFQPMTPCAVTALVSNLHSQNGPRTHSDWLQEHPYTKFLLLRLASPG